MTRVLTGTRSVLAPLALLSLTSCAQVGAAVGTAAVPVIASSIGVTAPVLSDIALAGCAAQAASNLAASVASQRGSTAWTAHFAKASQLAGIACSW